MNIALFEDSHWPHFLPLCYTRPVGALRHGILSNDARWSAVLNAPCFHHSRAYLGALFPPPPVDDALHINARLFPSPSLVTQISDLKSGEVLVHGDCVLAWQGKYADASADIATPGWKQISAVDPPMMLHRIADLFLQNGQAIRYDFDLLTHNRISAQPHTSVTLIGDPSNLFLEPGALVLDSSINLTEGPVYIGHNAEVMEGSRIRGPFALCEGSQVKMGAKIYGPTTIGPHAKVGGEISNSVFLGYANKAHDGFLGNSVIGEWCNLGADTNTSNLKNNYSNVRVFNYATNRDEDTGQLFHGLIMADHSRCGINTMFNTGTVVGVACNIFGAGFPAKHLPSFTWGGAEGQETYDLYKAMETAGRVMKRRGISFGPEWQSILAHIFNLTDGQRA
ncbi:MAG: GlmU family protein [Flavobacteriales bacterium]|nr:GlmU family protein [Flavobacteriales bacterium]